jgi:cytochrome P450
MAETITRNAGRVPPGPAADYSSSEDLFLWMNENFARHGDIYQATIYGETVYVVSNPEHCERVLRRNWRNYARSGQVVKRIALLLGNGLISSNGEFWASQRRMVQPSFTKSSVGGFAGMMRQANTELLEQWIAAARTGQTVNVTRDVSAMVLKITLLSIFGDDYPVVAPQFDMLADDRTRNLEFAQAFRAKSRVILDVAARRRRDGVRGGDILDNLMHARDRDRGEPMSDAQMAKEAITLVVAGHETTAGLLNWVWYLLSRHPEVEARLAEELARTTWECGAAVETLGRYDYTKQVIEEALRLYPPLWMMTRRALQEDRLGDFVVPKGTEIYISPYLIQRNPEFWEVPERFDPDRMAAAGVASRPELAMCPFGAGPRNCIGESFARLEMQMHLVMFASRLRLRHDETEPAEFTTGMNLLSRDDFIMRPELKATPDA